MKVKILSDSACDLPQSIIEEYNIDILPIIVIKDDKEYLDGITIQSKDVYDGMRRGEIFKTAQIPPNAFTDKFLEYAKKGETVVYLAFSSRLSGTYQTSLVVRESILEQYPNFDLEIIDTKAASLGFGLIVYHIARMAKEGKAKEEILEAAKFYRENIEHIFTVDDIEYLYRGGRVTRTQAFLGGLLSIKPLLHVEDGRLVPLERIRGKNKVFKAIIELMKERTKKANLKEQLIGISHCDDLESAMRIKEMIKEEFGCDSFLINTIGAAIGAHSGPGTLAVYFFKKSSDRFPLK